MLPLLRRHDDERQDSWCYNDNDDNSIMIELKFLNDIPEPPPYLHMLEFYPESERPTYPIIELNITVSNTASFDNSHLFKHQMIAWQVQCKNPDPSLLIDNPVFVYDDSWQVTIFDMYDKYSSYAKYLIQNNRTKISKNSFFQVRNMKIYKFSTFQNMKAGNSTMKLQNYNNLLFLYLNVTFYQCIANNMKSKLFEYTYKGVLVDTVFTGDDICGTNKTILTHAKNNPVYIEECKNSASSKEK
ncbi:hypothetical protein RF11_10255 [Thelohanellus kitauei]|uniref:Uncharacterized protein n=1 Tax=Thelohanellus kitauei TaxID=669202 RepID=A0A0C2NDV9_THEKT|nr:hypothetical protein RF11_10255 [Thelohanellus kitauei]